MTAEITSVALQSLEKGCPGLDMVNIQLKQIFLQYGGRGNCPSIAPKCSYGTHNAVLTSALSQVPRDELIRFVGLLFVIQSLGLPLNGDLVSALLDRSLMGDDAVKKYLQAKAGSEALGVISMKTKHFPTTEDEVEACVRGMECSSNGVDIAESYRLWRVGVLTKAKNHLPMGATDNINPIILSNKMFAVVRGVGSATWIAEGIVPPEFVTTALGLAVKKFYVPDVGAVNSFDLANFRNAPGVLKRETIFDLFNLKQVTINGKEWFDKDNANVTPKADGYAVWGVNPSGVPFIAEGMFTNCTVRLFEGRFFSLGRGACVEVPKDVLKTMLLVFAAFGGQLVATQLGYRFSGEVGKSRVIGSVRNTKIRLMSASEEGSKIYVDHEFKKVYCVMNGQLKVGSYDELGQFKKRFDVEDQPGLERYVVFKDVPSEKLKERMGMVRCETCKMIEHEHTCFVKEERKKVADFCENFEALGESNRSFASHQSQVSKPSAAQVPSASVSSTAVAKEEVGSGALSHLSPQAAQRIEREIKLAKKGEWDRSEHEITFQDVQNFHPRSAQEMEEFLRFYDGDLEDHELHDAHRDMVYTWLVSCIEGTSCFSDEEDQLEFDVEGKTFRSYGWKDVSEAVCEVASSPYLGALGHAVNYGLFATVRGMCHVFGYNYLEVLSTKWVPRYAAPIDQQCALWRGDGHMNFLGVRPPRARSEASRGRGRKGAQSGRGGRGRERPLAIEGPKLPVEAVQETPRPQEVVTPGVATLDNEKDPEPQDPPINVEVSLPSGEPEDDAMLKLFNSDL